ncbi:EF-hand domain-containing protein [Lysobacter sp. GCM10012299]|uniref:EF-hand domain-containing protein n=1 Tax=Lysobacter sp. GCM10012299 TaxID=3317333 RepID=UPI0036200ADE
MTIHSRKPLFAAVALVAALSAPLAFAQSASPAPAAQDPASQDAAAAQAEPASAAPTSAPQKKSWADVDSNKDGALSKTEAATVPALGQVFDKADSNADGALTTDEYKAYVAKVQAAPKSGSGG